MNTHNSDIITCTLAYTNCLLPYKIISWPHIPSGYYASFSVLLCSKIPWHLYLYPLWFLLYQFFSNHAIQVHNPLTDISFVKITDDLHVVKSNEICSQPSTYLTVQQHRTWCVPPSLMKDLFWLPGNHILPVAFLPYWFLLGIWCSFLSIS